MKVVLNICLVFLATVASLVLGQRAGSNAHDHTAAFSVGLANTLHVTQGETIIYNRVFTNVGNGYDILSGVFRCPRSGHYVFHLYAYDSNTDKAMWLELYRETEYIMSISGYNSHSSAGNSCIIPCRSGERVFLKARPMQDFTLFGQRDEVYATFSGYLLTPEPVTRSASGGIVG